MQFKQEEVVDLYQINIDLFTFKYLVTASRSSAVSILVHALSSEHKHVPFSLSTKIL
jgi:hypothetical protein